MWEVIHLFCEEIWRFDENPEKSGKKSGNRINFRNEKSSYDIWEVKHPFREEIWSKLLKSEDLRSAPLRKKKLKKTKKKRFLNFGASLTK